MRFDYKKISKCYEKSKTIAIFVSASYQENPSEAGNIIRLGFKSGI
jgi:hypothetical protein